MFGVCVADGAEFAKYYSLSEADKMYRNPSIVDKPNLVKLELHTDQGNVF